MHFSTPFSHLVFRSASFVFFDQPWNNDRLRPSFYDKKISKTSRTITSYLASRAILITALKTTRFAITNGALLNTSLFLACAVPLVSYFKESLTISNKNVSFIIDYQGLKIANLISTVGCMAAIVFRAVSPLAGGLMLGANLICMYTEGNQ